MQKFFGALMAVFGGILIALDIVIFIVMFPNPPLLGWIAILIVLILGFASIRLGKRLYGKAAPPAPSTPENTGGLLINTTTPMETEGFPFTYHFRPQRKGKGGHPALLTITVNDGWGIPFVARPRGGFDSFGSRLGLSIPLVTGDEAFDQMVYVETNHPRAMELYFSKAANRQAVMEVLALGFDNVSSSPEGMVAKWTGYKPQQRDTLADQESAAMRLAFLSQGGTGIQGLDLLDKEGVASGNRAYLNTWLSSLLVIVFIGSFLAKIVPSLQPPGPLRFFDLFYLSLKCMAVIFPAFLFITFYYLRGRTTSHRDWFACGALGFLVLAGSTPWTVHLINVWRDSSPAIVFHGKIKFMRTTKSRSTTTYFLTTPSRTDPTATHEFTVTQQVFQVTVPGTPFRLVTHAGYLGIEWVESFEVGGR